MNLPGRTQPREIQPREAQREILRVLLVLLVALLFSLRIDSTAQAQAQEPAIPEPAAQEQEPVEPEPVEQEPVAPEPVELGTAWSQPYNLGQYWFPDIAVDSADTAHIAWSSGEDGFDTVMYTARAADGTWAQTVDVQAQPQLAGSEATRPTLHIDSEQILNMTFRDIMVYHSQAPALTAWDARSWSQPQMIGMGYFSDFVEDANGTFHLVYTQNIPSEICPICYHLYYVYSDDRGAQWSEPFDISRITTGTAKPQMLIDSQNTIHIVFEAGPGGSYGGLTGLTTVMHVASFDLGRSWSFPVELDPARGDDDNLQARNIAIAEAGDGQLVVVWWSFPDDLINYQRSSDGGRTWTAPQAILGVSGVWAIYLSRLDIFSMATDGAGSVHLVMVGRRGADQPGADLLHLEWDGVNWSRPEAIAAYNGDMPEWPRIAIGLGNHLHVAWFVRDAAHVFQSDSGQYRVYYSERFLGFPGDAPVALPALASDDAEASGGAAEMEEASLALALPTTVALSPEQRQQNTAFLSQQNIMSENDDVLLLILAALPVLLLIGILFLVVRRRSSSRGL